MKQVSEAKNNDGAMTTAQAIDVRMKAMRWAMTTATITYCFGALVVKFVKVIECG